MGNRQVPKGKKRGKGPKDPKEKKKREGKGPKDPKEKRKEKGKGPKDPKRKKKKRGKKDPRNFMFTTFWLPSIFVDATKNSLLSRLTLRRFW